MARIRELLKDKNFSFLWFSQIISNFGDRLNQMALIGLVYSRTPGSTMELAKLMSFTILPVFFIGPVAGIYVDRWNRKYTMIACDILRGLLVFLIPFIISHSKSMVPVYIIVFVIFSITRFFLPSKMSIIPDIVHKDKLLLANSMTSTTMMIATIVGFGLGGMLVAGLGPQGGFYVDAVTYLASAIMVSYVSIDLKKKIDLTSAREKLKSMIEKTIIGDIKEGLMYFKGNKDIRLVANTMFLLMAGVGSIYIIIIVFVQQVLGSSTQHLGLLAMFLGAGLFLGSVGYGRFGSGLCKKKVINSGLFVAGFIIIVFAIMLKLWPYFFIAALLSAVLGLFAAPIVVSSNTLLHEVMVDEMRGRIFSSLEIVMHVGFLIFMLLTSLVAEITGNSSILIAVGSIFSIIGMARLIKGIRGKN
jgi:MFS family permease